MKRIKRKYSCKDLTMLLAAQIIADNLKDNISELSVVNKKWTIDYADDLIFRIYDILNNNLGIYVKKELREASNNLKILIEKTKNNLASFKRFAEVYYKDKPLQKENVFSSLGLNQYYLNAVKKNQSALINILCAFKSNVSDSLRSELKNNGLSENVLDEIIENAEKIIITKNLQEKNKLLSKEITFNRRILFNGIYDEIINICYQSAPFYKNSPVKKDMFTFSKVAGISHKKSKGEKQNNTSTHYDVNSVNIEDVVE